jgi:predicted unusual protein kinase regulating ubiquinone biosynthesis (AarF/ABC1/UbiB family)
MMYVKIFQAFATNRTILSPELNNFFNDYTDNVEYTDREYNDDDLIELERKSVECYPYKPIKILNNRKPIKSGLMSLIFKGQFVDDGDDGDDGAGDGGEYIAIKYLRNDIITNFNTSMNNLVVFAKLTKYIPYIRTLNIETVILQNIVCLKDQVCFRKEVANIQQYYKTWKDCDYVKIPQPYSEFTEKINPNIIVMEFINGMKITEIGCEDNDRFGKILASFNAKAAFCNSIYHGDLHPGNILFIKDSPSASYKIGILDFGIIGHLTRLDQELLFKSTKLLYQKKHKRAVHMILKEMSEYLNPNDDIMNATTTVNLDDELFHKIHGELHAVIVECSTPEIKFLGVNELYTINYILNKYNLTFRRSLYRLFITVAIMDSIATKLGSEMSYMQHMADVVIDLFGIDAGNLADD